MLKRGLRLKEAAAFSPAHITGLVEICDYNAEPLFNGSRGAGVSIEKGVTTNVRVESSSKLSFKISINNKETKSAEVSEHVIQVFLSKIENKYRIIVNHDVEVPIGSGFGSSGAAALSLYLALNKIFDLNLSMIQTAQIAHIADVECRTGLGTVIAETYGGLEVRVKPGAPGIGDLKQIPINGNCSVACLNFAPISKRSVLTDNKLRERINMFGGKLIDELIKDSTSNNFMRLSRQFAEHIGLISVRMRKILNEADREGITCSMAMFGETLFALVEYDSLERLLKIFHKDTLYKHSIIVSGIDFKGIRLL